MSSRLRSTQNDKETLRSTEEEILAQKELIERLEQQLS